MSRIPAFTLCVLTALATSASAAGVRQWEITPTALVTRDQPPLQRIAMSIDSEANLADCRLEVWVGDNKVADKALGQVAKERHELPVLLPEPTAAVESRWVLLDSAGKTLAERALTWKPPRHWTLYVIKSAHFDIGLHSSQYRQRHMSVAFLDQARENADRTADWPEASRSRYVVEGLWWWLNYPADRSEAAAARLVRDYVRPGVFGIGATHSGNHTQEFGTEELCRSTYYTQQVRDRWGLAADTMMMVDNNGITWPLVTAYADAGIRYLAFLPNKWRSRVDVGWDSPLPHLFYWQGPDEKSRLLVWANPHYIHTGHDFGIRTCKDRTKALSTPETTAPEMAKQLARLEARYPYDIWLVSNYDDNETPNLEFPTLAKAWNARWRWPELRSVGDLSEPFREVEKRFGDKIPTLRGDITGGWAQHTVSTPSYLARKREADRLLPTAEKLATLARLVDPSFVYPTRAFRQAWDALICSDEHGYGVSSYRGRDVYETWLQKRDWIDRGLATAQQESGRALAALASHVPTEGPMIVVFNPLVHPRTEMVEVQLPEALAAHQVVCRADGRPVASEAKGRQLRFLASEVPSLGYATFRLAKGSTAEATTHPASEPPTLENSFYRVTFAADGSIAGIFDKQLQRQLVDGAAPYRCNQFAFTKDGHKTFATPGPASFEVQTCPLGRTVIARMEEPASGAALTQCVTLLNHEKRIDIDNRLDHVRDVINNQRTKYLRYGYYAFPFDVPKGVFRTQLNGCIARPHDDQTGHGTEDWLAAQDWIDVANAQFGVVVVQRESHLVEFGGIRTNQLAIAQPVSNAHLYSYLFNDWFQKNWIGPSQVNLRYRYVIRSHTGDDRDGTLTQFAARCVHPMQTSVIPKAQSGRLPSSQSFLTVNAPNVELLALKLSEAPGRGVIARFHETGGRAVEAMAVEQQLSCDLQATRCSIVEQDLGQLDRRVLAMRPFGIATVRLTVSGAALSVPRITVGGVSDKSVILQWEPIKGAQQYNVFRGEDPGFAPDAYHLHATTTRTTLTDDWLDRGRAYHYRVAAVGPGNRQGAVSDVVSATTAAQGDASPAKVGTHDRGLISAPRAWRAEDADTLYLLWGQNSESDLSHYELYRSESPEFQADAKTFLAKVEPGPYVVVGFEDKHLQPHTTYYYRVRAVDRDGHKGSLSDVWAGTTRVPPPPQGKRPTATRPG